ncbi:MAG: hypothetical protein GWO24_18950, partial [Akkermansiaceae bacterium]|nr:hypothetical protein [Akkermansiaceae bacterium]
MGATTRPAAGAPATLPGGPPTPSAEPGGPSTLISGSTQASTVGRKGVSNAVKITIAAILVAAIIMIAIFLVAKSGQN